MRLPLHSLAVTAVLFLPSCAPDVAEELSAQGAKAESDQAGSPFPHAPRRLSRTTLEDKVRGGWAGQMIGVAYGAPTEF